MYVRSNLLQPSDAIQKEILCGAIVELLWKVLNRCENSSLTSFKCGDRERAVLAILDVAIDFEPTVFYSADGLTEKVNYLLF